MEFHFDFHFRIASFLTRTLDEYGLDPIIGLIPVVGDVVTLAVSWYLVWIAQNAGVPKEKITQMKINIVKDVFIGFIPIIGDIGDFVFKANRKNLAILEEFRSENQHIVDAEVLDD